MLLILQGRSPGHVEVSFSMMQINPSLAQNLYKLIRSNERLMRQLAFLPITTLAAKDRTEKIRNIIDCDCTTGTYYEQEETEFYFPENRLSVAGCGNCGKWNAKYIRLGGLVAPDERNSTPERHKDYRAITVSDNPTNAEINRMAWEHNNEYNDK